MRALLAIALAGSIAVGLTACGGDDSPGEPEEATSLGEADGAKGNGAQSSGADDASREQGELVDVRESEFGPIVVDGEDRTLYLFDKEAGETSECYGDCAEAWPPFLTEGEPRAARGAEEGLLGTTRRDDGTTQVTYKGHPLYYYVDDPPGQVLCHNVEEFGGLWLVVNPQGDAVQ